MSSPKVLHVLHNNFRQTSFFIHKKFCENGLNSPCSDESHSSFYHQIEATAQQKIGKRGSFAVGWCCILVLPCFDLIRLTDSS